jgi:anti-sigma factor RsiW
MSANGSMNDNDTRKSDIIHRVLDGDISPEERDEFEREMEADPELRAEYEGISRALRNVAKGARKTAPPLFTAAVMKRLPRRRETPAARLRAFQFRGRIARWSMAAALVTALVVVIGVALAVHQRAGNPTVSSRQEPVVTVRLYYYAPAARRVAVAGTFNKWTVDTDALTRRDNGIWTIDVALKPGVYTYMFVVNGSAWVTDPHADSYRDDGFGFKNSVLRIQA